MIIPFVMSLLTINRHPYLWYFYKSLDMAKRYNWPVIAQEKYFTKPSVLVKEGGMYENLIKNQRAVNFRFIYELPSDEDLDQIKKYPIPQSMEDKLVKETGSFNNAMAFALKDRWTDLENLLDKYFSDIKKESKEKIEAVITLCWYPSLENAAKKHNIRVITIEQGLFREPAYLKTAYFSFTNLFDDEKEIEERYNAFKKVCHKLPILSRKDILSLVLNDEYLGYLNYYDSIPRYEMGVILGYTTWMPHMCHTFFNDEELLFKTASSYDKFIARRHPGDPASATYPFFIKTPDNSANTIEFILKCKRIASLGSNVSLESAYWNRSSYTTLKCSSSYGQKHDIEDKEEYSVDILYLNFFAFCFLIPYSKMMDPEYIMWRLSRPSEAEIFKKHMQVYLEQRNCDMDKLISTASSERMGYILKCRGYEDSQKLSYPNVSPFSSKKKNDIPPEMTAAVAAENQALKREINQHIATERKYEAALAKMKGHNVDFYINAYESMLNSTSWKFTKPFRAVMTFIKRILK